MFLRVLFLFLISSSIFATDFRISYGFKKYDVHYDDQFISFTTKDMNFVLANKACFSERFKKFKTQLETITEGVTLRKSGPKEKLQFIRGEEIYGAEENSPFGRRLLSLPRDMIKMKLIEKDLCSSNKKK